MGGPPRGRGGPTRGRGAPRGAKAAAPVKTPAKPSQPKVVKTKTSKTEKERDANDMLKPWVTPELREEIQKKHEMHSASRKSGEPSDFDAFKQQRNKVSSMLRAAKLEYIGLHDEEDIGKIMAEVGLNQSIKATEAAVATEVKSEPVAAENGTESAVVEQGSVENGSVAVPAAGGAENGVQAEPTAA